MDNIPRINVVHISSVLKDFREVFENMRPIGKIQILWLPTQKPQTCSWRYSHPTICYTNPNSIKCFLMCLWFCTFLFYLEYCFIIGLGRKVLFVPVTWVSRTCTNSKNKLVVENLHVLIGVGLSRISKDNQCLWNLHDQKAPGWFLMFEGSPKTTTGVIANFWIRFQLPSPF